MSNREKIEMLTKHLVSSINRFEWKHYRKMTKGNRQEPVIEEEKESQCSSDQPIDQINEENCDLNDENEEVSTV